MTMHTTDIEQKTVTPLTARLIDIAIQNAVANSRYQPGRKKKWRGMNMAINLKLRRVTIDGREGWRAFGESVAVAASVFKRLALVAHNSKGRGAVVYTPHLIEKAKV